MKKLLGLLLVALLLFGCVEVVTKTTAFYTPDYKIRGSISVVAAEAAVNSSLEFARYKTKFEEKLADKGYSIASNPSEAQFIAFVSYGIDTGKNANVSTPIFGQTGGGTSYSYGSVGGTSFSGTSYSMPTYGVVGSINSSVAIYTRAIALDIVDAASLKAGHAVKVYEARAKSSGTCSVMAGVFEEILEALFTEFPGENGKVRTITVQSKGNC
ncbi:DUF4136 domain-containing protein [Oryzomonas rubra]|uniref:DUF4136 domain-containing protein n=1 Tax=Oryzomonas rubra TaxID=2509454 RepID=A0A5A9X6Y2_9BACT|nr:DUF4136 domain-containing protein [Oryzomonas rubra]KAA0888135.1 DUF4136 domain-containing protein [Oryzomonas rubra]